ncbi:hypothetical protein Tco_0594769 [Tanacetum coccineum]
MAPTSRNTDAGIFLLPSRKSTTMCKKHMLFSPLTFLKSTELEAEAKCSLVLELEDLTLETQDAKPVVSESEDLSLLSQETKSLDSELVFKIINGLLNHRVEVVVVRGLRHPRWCCAVVSTVGVGLRTTLWRLGDEMVLGAADRGAGGEVTASSGFRDDDCWGGCRGGANNGPGGTAVRKTYGEIMERSMGGRKRMSWRPVWGW